MTTRKKFSGFTPLEINFKNLTNRKKSKSLTGFTLVELLITIAIIGILAAIVLVNLSSARNKGRDAKRVADIHEILTALQLYYNDNQGYPTPDVPSLTGPDPASGNPAWNTYMIQWPSSPIPADNTTGLSDCNSSGAGTGTNQYGYSQTNSGGNFALTFCLGAQTGSYPPGFHTITADGLAP